MSDIIRLLPEHVANQIAAGEVVQRPASVVKELLDNSIDAGARHIRLHIKEAGKLMIQVQDDGKGMSATDARMCWERHATSKIQTADDLFRLRTMGFRGEALASIAAVAQVELRTRRAEDELGTCIQIEGSEVMSQEYVACAGGSQITVKNLFYNVPARRNFLKSTAVETRHIVQEFIRTALAHPELGLELRQQDVVSYKLAPADLRGRILQLFDDRKTDDLIPFEEETSIWKVSGFVSTPTSSRKSRDEQFFFVNNRFVKDPYLHHAVMGCYEQLISKEQFPLYIVNIEIDPKEIDVNIHPTKTEIKFQDERSIYLILKTAIRKALGNFYSVPMYESSAVESFIPSRPLAPGTVTMAPEIKTSKNLNPAFTNPPAYKRDSTLGWEKLFERPEEATPQFTPQLPLHRTAKEQIVPGVLLQIDNRFIVAQAAGGLILIHQHAAHERILFERYLLSAESHPALSQQKLFPKIIELGKADFELSMDLIPELKLMGFDVMEFGKQNIIIHGIPADVPDMNEEELIMGILADYKQSAVEGKEKRKEILAMLLARRASIKSGSKLKAEEMQSLAEELFYCEEPAFTPQGQRTYIKIESAQIADMFKR